MEPTTSTTAPTGPFALDLRSLAVMRIGVGLLVIADLISRARDFAAHYGDHGVAPRADYLDRVAGDWHYSLHLSLDASGQIVLFLVAGLFALMLALGYRTRLATVATWLLLISLHSRNFMVLDAGDVLLRMMLLWGMFLPLGARFSIDAATRGGDPPAAPIRTVASMGLVVQLGVIYLAAAMFKLGHPVWWRDGLGVYYALSAEQFTTGFGMWVRDFPALLTALSYATLATQAAVPITLAIAWRRNLVRIPLAALLIVTHALYALCLSIGLSSWIAATLWLAMLPAPFWEWAAGRITRTRARNKPAPAGEQRRNPIAGFAGRLLARDRERRGERIPPPTAACSSWLAKLLCGALIVYGVWWNASQHPFFKMSPTAQIPGRLLRLEQKWTMFSNPTRHSGWYVMPAKLADGSSVDVWAGGEPVSWKKPSLVADTFPSQRWRTYMVNLEHDRYRRFRGYLLDYYCRRWNEAHATARHIKRIDLYFVKVKTPLPGKTAPPPERIRLGRRDCTP